MKGNVDMKRQAVNVTENLLEQVCYQDNSLPISYCIDYFDNFINGEVNYHWHNEVEFAVILQGEVEYFVHQANMEQKPHILHKGDGVFVNMNTLHMVRQKCPGSVMSCCLFPSNFFTFQLAGSIYINVQPVLQNPTPGLFFSYDNHADKKLLDCLYDFLNLDKNIAGYELLCLESVCRIWRQLLFRFLQMENIADIQKVETLQEQRIRLMLSYIHTHYFENITIEDIAKSANISKSECFRCFKGIVKKTPVDYLLDYRLSRAAGLLTNTEQTVLDIGLSCGFQNPSYFGKIFKEKCNVTPGQFRKQTRTR